MPRLVMIAGIATLTMVVSTMISATPRLIATSPHQRRRSGVGSVMSGLLSVKSLDDGEYLRMRYPARRATRRRNPRRNPRWSPRRAGAAAAGLQRRVRAAHPGLRRAAPHAPDRPVRAAGRDA